MTQEQLASLISNLVAGTFFMGLFLLLHHLGLWKKKPPEE